MAAFNTIVIEDRCPSCGAASTLRFQTHVAADFGERFCLRDYRVGERMAWWPANHQRFQAWNQDPGVKREGEASAEACCGACDACQADLFAVIRFVDVTPVFVEAIGMEKDWPVGFLK